MSSEHESWSKRFNKALRDARGVTVEQTRDEDRHNDTMSNLIRSAVDRKRDRVDQDPEDRGREE